MSIHTDPMTTRHRTLKVAAAGAALSLALAGCGSQDTTKPAEVTQPTSASAPPAAPSAQGTNNPLAKDVAGSADLVYTALATATASMPGAKVIGYDFENTTHEVTVSDGQTAQKLTIATDGTTVQKTENDDVDGDDRKNVTEASVTAEQAMKAALKEVPGVPQSAELDRDHELVGRDGIGWKIAVVDTSDKKHEVLIDAVKGTVLKKNVDH